MLTTCAPSGKKLLTRFPLLVKEGHVFLETSSEERMTVYAKHLARFLAHRKYFIKKNAAFCCCLSTFLYLTAISPVYATIKSHLNYCSHLWMGFPEVGLSPLHPSCTSVSTHCQPLRRHTTTMYRQEKWGYNLCTQRHCPRNVSI